MRDQQEKKRENWFSQPVQEKSATSMWLARGYALNSSGTVWFTWANPCAKTIGLPWLVSTNQSDSLELGVELMAQNEECASPRGGREAGRGQPPRGDAGSAPLIPASPYLTFLSLCFLIYKLTITLIPISLVVVEIRKEIRIIRSFALCPAHRKWGRRSTEVGTRRMCALHAFSGSFPTALPP